jgi:hypothetical protein
MNKKFWLSGLLVFVATYALGFVLHGVLLQSDYAQFPNLMRTQAEMMKRMYWMVLGDLSFALAFVWIYLQGLKQAPWVGQGLRFGLAVFAVAQLPGFMIEHAVQPWPATLTLKQICGEAICMLLLGLLVGFVYRKEAGGGTMTAAAR